MQVIDLQACFDAPAQDDIDPNIDLLRPELPLFCVTADAVFASISATPPAA
ncbi:MULTISPECIES: hypothetical protein [unclassified Variovorax]|jgi:hypothetical protein|uniref:hypothetical protein n=1 Tax=unclassified Variovorax TaxID=663243 RepID=UPI00159F7B6B|nr:MULTISPECIES: hypothetical protein [unclassified Variovorax]